MTDSASTSAPIAEEQNETAALAANNAEQNENVHHLHPLSLLLKIIAFLPQFIFGTIAATISIDDDLGRLIVGAGLLLGVVIFGFIAWLRWRKFTYEIGENEVLIKSGIFARNNRAIPYERIQDVNIEQKLLARILGLATLKLETGSAGDGNDGELNAVKLARAEELRDMIRARKRASHDAVPSSAETLSEYAQPADDSAESTTIFTMDTKRLLILGVFSFSLAIFAFLLAATQQVNFLIPDRWFDVDNFIHWIETDPEGSANTVRGSLKGAENRLFSLNPIWQILAALAGLSSVIIVGVFTGIISVFVREYGFRLDRTDNGFRRRRGLFTLTDVAMPLHRVQTALLVTGPLRRRFGWYALKFQSLASDGKNESDHVVAPLARRDEAIAIAAEPNIDIDVDVHDMTKVSIAMWLVPLLFFAIIIGFAASNAVFWSGKWPLGFIGILLVPFALHLWLRWRHHRYLLTEHFLYIKTGYWSQKLTALPLRKIQSLDITDNFIQRPLDQADVILGIAGGSGILPLTLHAINRQTAYDMRDIVLDKMRAAALAQKAQ